MKKAKTSWTQLLTAENLVRLKEIGQLLMQARKSRKMSLVELATRIGVDRRTLTELEKGSPTVSLGIFFQVLSIFNLLDGITEIARPENDLESIATNIRRIRRHQRAKVIIRDDEVDF